MQADAFAEAWVQFATFHIGAASLTVWVLSPSLTSQCWDTVYRVDCIRRVIPCLFTSSSSCSWTAVGLAHLLQNVVTCLGNRCSGEVGKHWVWVRDVSLGMSK